MWYVHTFVRRPRPTERDNRLKKHRTDGLYEAAKLTHKQSETVFIVLADTRTIVPFPLLRPRLDNMKSELIAFAVFVKIIGFPIKDTGKVDLQV